MASPASIPEQIADAVQSAVASKDFSGLQATIDRTVDAAAEGVGRGIAQASDAVRRGQEQYARIQQRKADEALMNELYAKPAATRGGGVALVVAGCCVGVPLAAVGSLLAALGAGAGGVLAVLGAAACVGLVLAGSRKLKLAKRFERYRAAIGPREQVAIGELAAACAEKPADAKRHLRQMISKGLLKQASIDEADDQLLMTAAAASRQRALRAAELERDRQRELVQEAVGPDAAASPDQQQLLERGEAFLAQIRIGNDAIPDAALTATLDDIERVVRAIFDAVRANPEVTADLGRLMDYYLPTTVKLLDAYRDLERQPVQTESTAASKREIAGALSSLNTAFRKLLAGLQRERAIDVSSDIAVLHAVLAQEGLTDGPFDKPSSDVGE